MKIVHCVYQMETGGCEVLVVDLLNEMSKTNEMHLVILNNQANENLLRQLNQNVKVYCLKRKPGSYNPFPILNLNLLLLKLKPDIIHCHVASMIRLIVLGKFTFILTIHSVNLSHAFHKRYHYLVAISDAVFKNVRMRCPYPLGQVNNGVPDNVFKKREQYHLGKEERVKLVQVSRLIHDWKGQDILLRALCKLVYEYKVNNVSVDFIGSGESHQYLKNLASELRLQAHVNFMGEKSRDWLFTNLSGYHALIQPSKYEGFGLTIVEGLRAGLPIVASEVDGPAQILSGHPAGFLFENCNSDSCARQIYHLIDLYKTNKLINKMTTRNNRPDFSIAACCSGYLQIYENVIMQNSRGKYN